MHERTMARLFASPKVWYIVDFIFILLKHFLTSLVIFVVVLGRVACEIFPDQE